MLGVAIIIVLFLLLIVSLPVWPYNRGWNYMLAGFFGMMVVVTVILMIVGLLVP